MLDQLANEILLKQEREAIQAVEMLQEIDILKDKFKKQYMDTIIKYEIDVQDHDLLNEMYNGIEMAISVLDQAGAK